MPTQRAKQQSASQKQYRRISGRGRATQPLHRVTQQLLVAQKAQREAKTGTSGATGKASAKLQRVKKGG